MARPAGGNAFTIVGQSDIKTPTAGQLNTYSDRIPILTGDVIGLTILTEGECFRNSAGYEWRALNGDPQPGSTDTYNVEAPGIQFDIAALIEPDCDEDGLGDETQDPSLFGGSCPARGRFVRLDANKNKVRKGKKVTLTGSITEQARAGECQGGQTVQVQRKKPSQTSFTTFTQLQTDAQGSFSLKKKVKKTFEYRAQVVETATCTSALSNTEKVKVKKKR